MGRVGSGLITKQSLIPSCSAIPRASRSPLLDLVEESGRPYLSDDAAADRMSSESAMVRPGRVRPKTSIARTANRRGARSASIARWRKAQTASAIRLPPGSRSSIKAYRPSSRTALERRGIGSNCSCRMSVPIRGTRILDTNTMEFSFGSGGSMCSTRIRDILRPRRQPYRAGGDPERHRATQEHMVGREHDGLVVHQILE